jgi:hypothetical protein
VRTLGLRLTAPSRSPTAPNTPQISKKRAAKRAPSEPSDSEANDEREMWERPKARCQLIKIFVENTFEQSGKYTAINSDL